LTNGCETPAIKAQERPLAFYIIANTLTPGIMGGDLKICIEFARRWAKAGNNVTVITSEDGVSVCLGYGLRAHYLTVPSVKFRRLGRPMLHLIQAVLTFIMAREIAKEPSAVLYSASNFWCDVFPALWIKSKKLCTWIGTSFLPILHPFKSLESAYEKGVWSWPNPKVFALFLFQRISDLLLSRHADAIFITNDLDKSTFIKAGVSPKRLLAIYGGVDHEAISTVPEDRKEFDGVFLGRLHPQKGLLFLIDIWHRVCARRTGAKLAIIGSGDKHHVMKIQAEIRRRGLGGNVKMFGFVDGYDKYKILKSSRVFLHTSIYDNCGMAAAEGMACGLPAVRFDIPALRLAYPKGMLVASLKDCQAFADAVLALLSNSKLCEEVRRVAVEAMRSWDWNDRAERALKVVQVIVDKQSGVVGGK